MRYNETNSFYFIWIARKKVNKRNKYRITSIIKIRTHIMIWPGSCLFQIYPVLSSAQFTQLCLTLCNPMDCSMQSSLSITNSRSLLKLMSIESVMPSNHLILYCPLLLLPSIFPIIRVFSSESVLWIRWPKPWIFSFCISLSSESSGLISFKIEWFDLLAVQGSQESSRTP